MNQLSENEQSGTVCDLGMPDLSAPGRGQDADTLHKSGLPLSAMLMGLLDQSDDCIKIIDEEGRLQFMSCNGRQAMQIDDFETVKGMAWSELWPEASRGAIDSAVETAMGGNLARFEAECPTAKGEDRWWQVTVSPIRDPDGKVRALLSTSQDISERKQREEVLEAISGEMRHRLMNAYTIASSLLLTLARGAPEHADFARSAAERLGALAQLQGKLVESAGAMTLGELIDHTLHTYSDEHEIDLTVECRAVELDEQRARAFTLVIGELANNSFKHGSLGRGGKVTLDCALQDGALDLVWRDDFDAAIAAPSLGLPSGGRGRDLMTQVLRLFRGSFETEQGADWYRATMHMPLPR
ncbi:PAS domain-containing protein [Sphingomicrobium sp. XHP0235]|uniref:sensor histidine kinase n=1 Tax=Sphingomicrobium aquimarinum TaxID=3133971 RepID=UPI0031FF1307